MRPSLYRPLVIAVGAYLIVLGYLAELLHQNGMDDHDPCEAGVSSLVVRP